jgi:hypothetical protein
MRMGEMRAGEIKSEQTGKCLVVRRGGRARLINISDTSSATVFRSKRRAVADKMRAPILP